MSEGRVVGGRYRLLRRIAEGGMGVVWEAQHEVSRNRVALKVLRPHRDGKDAIAVARFSREVAAPAQIAHDGICQVYDAGLDQSDGSFFVAMELLEGETLRARFAKGRMPLDTVLSIFEQLLDALAAAHAAGLVHRDLKPENVFLQAQRDGRERVKLLDFGIAREMSSDAAVLTQSGLTMGTPHYMSPEQAMSAHHVSFPTDVWAVGAMLFEALSGRTPYQGLTTSAIIVKLCTEAPAPLMSVAPDVPGGVAAFVDRCLSRDPSRRPATAGVMLAELRALRAPLPQTAAFAPTQAFEMAITRPLPSAPRVPVPTPMTPSAHGASTHELSAPPVGLVSSHDASTPRGVLSSPGVVAPISTARQASAPGVPVLHHTPQPIDHAPRHTTRSSWLVPLVVVLALVVVGGGAVAVFGLGALAVVASTSSSTSGGQGELLATHEGTLAPGDARLRSGEYEDSYQYLWNSGEHVRLDVSSAQLDPYLILRYPSGRQLDNDDAVAGRDRNALLDITLDESGPYQIIVTSHSPGEQGSYRLTIRR